MASLEQTADQNRPDVARPPGHDDGRAARGSVFVHAGPPDRQIESTGARARVARASGSGTSEKENSVLDREALGLAVGLAALAVHGLHALAPHSSDTLDAAARVVAFVLLPGWAAVRSLPG